MDWSAIGPLVAPFAPTIGGLLGGLIPIPGGAMLGKAAGNILAEALGVPPTPADVHTAITTGDPAVVQAKLTEAETKMQTELEKFKAQIADVQDARATNFKLAQIGSQIAWGPVVVSAVILLGFIMLSFLAMKPEAAGVRYDVVLYLLGAWQSLATGVAGFWLGSSAGSSEKSAQIAALAGAAVTAKTAPLRK